MSPSSPVHGGQHDTKYVTFELLMHAPFVADEILGFMLEPARTLNFSTLKKIPHDCMNKGKNICKYISRA